MSDKIPKDGPDSLFYPGRPSVLGVQLEVNLNTVMRAYECLQSREILSNKRGIVFLCWKMLSGKYSKNVKKSLSGRCCPICFSR